MKYASSILMTISVLFVAAISNLGCEIDSSDRQESRATERSMKEAQSRVGHPGITNFLEKNWVKMLYELRDSEVATFTYVADFNGGLHHVCDSVGYGIPASVQFSNPLKKTMREYPLPQAEPNGLFMPDGLEATYILCVDENGGGRPLPIYSEPKLVVTPFRLVAVDSWQANPPTDQIFR